MAIYADTGINWIFVYEVIYEDDCILVLQDLGRWHKYDEDRSWKRPIDQWINLGQEYARCKDGMKLVEVRPEKPR